MQQVRIDFDNPGLPQSLGAVEGESQSRIFQAALYKSGAAYTAPAGAVYSIMYRGFGPQNQGWYDTIEDGAGKRAACTVSFRYEALSPRMLFPPDFGMRTACFP